MAENWAKLCSASGAYSFPWQTHQGALPCTSGLQISGDDMCWRGTDNTETVVVRPLKNEKGVV